MNGLTEDQLLLRNLKDAGCGEADIERYFKLKSEGKEQEQFRFLSAHRMKLLDQVHASQEKLDCSATRWGQLLPQPGVAAR